MNDKIIQLLKLNFASFGLAFLTKTIILILLFYETFTLGLCLCFMHLSLCEFTYFIQQNNKLNLTKSSYPYNQRLVLTNLSNLLLPSHFHISQHKPVYERPFTKSLIARLPLLNPEPVNSQSTSSADNRGFFYCQLFDYKILG